MKFNSFKKSVMLVKLLAMHIFSIKVLIISLLQYGTIRLMYASDPDLAYLTENMKTDLSFYDKAELNAFYQCTGMVIYHLSHICLKKNLVKLTGFFFIIMTFEFIWFFFLGGWGKILQNCYTARLNKTYDVNDIFIFNIWLF